jgi:hypothetical protein
MPLWLWRSCLHESHTPTNANGSRGWVQVQKRKRSVQLFDGCAAAVSRHENHAVAEVRRPRVALVRLNLDCATVAAALLTQRR